MFEPRPRITHFVVRTVDGGEVDYRNIWQRAQLLLILLDESAASTRLAAVGAALAAREADLAAVEARLVVTRDVVAGTPRPGVVVADRYGEIAASLDASVETDADDLIDWLRVVQSRCG
jgi:hypothetical protein